MGPCVRTAVCPPCCLVSWRTSSTKSVAEVLSCKSVIYIRPIRLWPGWNLRCEVRAWSHGKVLVQLGTALGNAQAQSPQCSPYRTSTHKQSGCTPECILNAKFRPDFSAGERVKRVRLRCAISWQAYMQDAFTEMLYLYGRADMESNPWMEVCSWHYELDHDCTYVCMCIYLCTHVCMYVCTYVCM